ncbi:MAG: rhodanese-related sulfurtransferase [Gammaproteobacteria bacterium]|nr:rhodanese-related sulfurtransferase [Gammaproteobacteria bacterium]
MNVVSFYRFTDVPDTAALRGRLQALCDKHGLLGTILVAAEGINGTLAGDAEDILSVFAWLEDRLTVDEPIEGRWTESDAAPFRRLRVKVKKEIVTLGRPDIRPDQRTGKHVGVDEWNQLISDPETLVIDTRNRYEFELGTFSNAVDPETDSFRQFPAYAKKLADVDPGRKLAMFCTGGIRCEKATALMQELGFDEVYQLQGGILKYLEEVGDDDNLWRGECFVFDTRVAVDRDRAEGGYVQCHACRRPLSSEDLESRHYREGVSCPGCIDSLNKDRARRLEERRKQVALAAARGEAHIGATND